MSQAQYDYVLDQPVRILIVNDDAIQREFATVYVGSPNAEVVTAANGEEALGLLARERFDIVLIDYDMPGMNGVEVIRRMRADRRFEDIPVLMVTGHEDVETIDEAYRAGATSFATKPVNWRLLTYQIRYVLRATPRRPQPAAAA